MNIKLHPKFYEVMKEKQIPIIGISGKYGSGKDTVGDIICSLDKRFVKRAYAMKLKQIVATLTNTTLEDNLTREGKAKKIQSWDYKTLGQMQQDIGEIMRKMNENTWINALFSEYKIGEYWIITDMRHPNEVKEILEKGGIVIRIEGDPVNLRKENKDNRDLNHISETALDNYPFEHVIHNTNITLEELEEKVIEILLK